VNVNPNGRTLFWDVDTQVDFMLPTGELYVHGSEELLPNLARLTAAARARGITIVHTADDHEDGDPELAPEDKADFVDTFPPHCVRGTAGAERVPETAPPSGTPEVPWDGAGFDPAVVTGATEIVVHKKLFDVFSNPAAGALLDALAPDRVVVYGVALDICDRYAVEGMLDRGGFEVVVVKDAVKPIVPSNGRRLLSEWSKRGVRTLTTDEVLAELG
jgi:nicotinamidase/pyrazinamidase